VWRDLCFDLDFRDVTAYIRSENNMTFDRKIDGYLQPVGAVLIAEYSGNGSGCGRGHDGCVTTADAILALQMAVGGDYSKIADVSGDDTIVSIDALLILQMVVGNIGM